MSLSSVSPWFLGALLLSAVGGIAGAWLRNRRGDRPRHTRSEDADYHRGVLLALFAFFAAIALFGSLVPFESTSIELSTATARFRQLWASPFQLYSRTDTVANVLLFVPLGFFGAGALGICWARPFQLAWRAAALLLACFAYSIVLEFAQYWFPNRTPSHNDIAAQVVGTALGIGIWALVGRSTIRYLGLFFYSEGSKPIDVVLRAYAVVVLFCSVLPLDLTLSPASLYHKFRNGRILLLPFAGDPFASGHIGNTLSNILIFCTIGGLAAASRQEALRQTVLRSAIWGLVVGAAVEFAQLFVVSRHSSTFAIVSSMLSAGVGGIAIWWLRSLGASKRSQGADRSRAWPYWLLTAVYSAILVTIYVAPFSVLAEPARIAKRFQGIGRRPFSALFWSNELGAFESVLQKFLLFAPLGLIVGCGILQLSLSPRVRRACKWAAVGGLAALAAGIEIMQVYFPPHVADMTDMIIVTCCAVMGLLAAGQICGQPPISV